MPGSHSETPFVPLYTPEQRIRRDQSRWTLVQGVLAPLQFLVFAVSLVLVLRVLITNEGAELAAWSILLKTLVLYTIMVTGSLWEHDVYGQYLFAPAFYWEDVVSMGVIALHTAYVVMYCFDLGTTPMQLGVALAAYLAYVINAVQFVLKLRAARLGAARAAAAEPSWLASAQHDPVLRNPAQLDNTQGDSVQRIPIQRDPAASALPSGGPPLLDGAR